MAQMKAVRVEEGDRKPNLSVIDIPSVGPQDVLIKVRAAGLQPGPITLTQAGRLVSLPVTLGHEIAGEVHQVGELVQKLQVGDRVRVHPSLSCRACDFCLTERDQMCIQGGLMGFQGFGKEIPLFERYRDGGLAEFMRAPEWLVDVLPDTVSFEVGSKIQDLATAYNVLKQADLRPGSIIIVTAPTGAMGVSILKIAHLFGIQRLILVGRSIERLEAVRKLTLLKTDIVATDTFSKEALEKGELVGRLKGLLPQGADAIIDLLSSGTLVSQVIHGLKCNGVLVHLGGNVAKLEIPLLLMMMNCWKLAGTRMHSRKDAQTILKWLADGHLQAEELITHRWTLDQIDEAILQLQERSLPIWMSVVNP
jgi:D-arabinose 1-dehydrogenase-like Zn-dependent alcohol dehydrogenase